MNRPFYQILVAVLLQLTAAEQIYQLDVNFRVDAGTRTCFYESVQAGHMLELYYQVLNGQHGDLDISIDVIDPNGVKLIGDYKQSQNSIILDLEHDGDYAFCFDNTYSVINSKLVFIYVNIDDKQQSPQIVESEVSVTGNGQEYAEEEIIEWIGNDEDGNTYGVAVLDILESLMRTLQYVVRARHMLNLYSAYKSRDSYLALEDTFIVDVWSVFQICLMVCVGMLQVYMIKKLFDTTTTSTRC